MSSINGPLLKSDVSRSEIIDFEKCTKYFVHEADRLRRCPDIEKMADRKIVLTKKIMILTFRVQFILPHIFLIVGVNILLLISIKQHQTETISSSVQIFPDLIKNFYLWLTFLVFSTLQILNSFRYYRIHRKAKRFLRELVEIDLLNLTCILAGTIGGAIGTYCFPGLDPFIILTCIVCTILIPRLIDLITKFIDETWKADWCDKQHYEELEELIAYRKALDFLDLSEFNLSQTQLISRKSLYMLDLHPDMIEQFSPRDKALKYNKFIRLLECYALVKSNLRKRGLWNENFQFAVNNPLEPNGREQFGKEFCEKADFLPFHLLTKQIIFEYWMDDVMLPPCTSLSRRESIGESPFNPSRSGQFSESELYDRRNSNVDSHDVSPPFTPEALFASDGLHNIADYD